MRLLFLRLTILFYIGTIALSAHAQTPEYYTNRGYDLMIKKDYAGARRYFDMAISMKRDCYQAYYNRAVLSIAQNKWAAALPDLNSAIAADRTFFLAAILRAQVNEHLGNCRASLVDYTRIIDLTHITRDYDERAFMLNGRAWIRAACHDASIRNGQLAIADAKKACELTHWKHARYIDTLAAAYAEAGDFDSAVRYEQQAISVLKSEPADIEKDWGKHLSRDNAKKVADYMTKDINQFSQQFSHHLELYKQHRPCRETEYRNVW